MPLEDHGTYVSGTLEEISAYRDQQFAKGASNVAAGVAIVGVAAIAAATGAMIQENKRIKMLEENYLELYEALRPDFVDKIFSKAKARAIFHTLIPILIFCVVLPGMLLLFGEAEGALGALIPGLIFIPLWIIIIYRSSKVGYLSDGGMRISHKLICPQCNKKTLVIGYGMCRHCFGFLSESNRQEIMDIQDVPLPQNLVMSLKKDESVRNNNFFTAELTATSPLRRIRWLASPMSNILPIFIAIFAAIAISLGSSPYGEIALASAILFIIASAIARNTYKNSVNRDVERFCAAVANPKPVPVRNTMAMNANAALSAMEREYIPNISSREYIQKAPTSYKTFARIALGLFALWVCSFPILANNSSDMALMLLGIITLFALPASIIIGIIALVKRSKQKPKNKPKA